MKSKDPNVGSFLCPQESSAKKRDLTHSVIERAVSLRAHVNLQIQAINPTHICPSNACLRINSTRQSLPASLNHETKKRKWILKFTTQLWFTNIYSNHKAGDLQEDNTLGRHSPKQKRGKGPNLKQQRTEREARFPKFHNGEFQCILMEIMEADNSPVSELW